MIHSVQRMNAKELMGEAAAAHPGQLLRLGLSAFMRALGYSQKGSLRQRTAQSQQEPSQRHQITYVYEYIYMHSCMYISHQGRVGNSRDLANCSYTYLLKRQQTTYVYSTRSNLKV